MNKSMNNLNETNSEGATRCSSWLVGVVPEMRWTSHTFKYATDGAFVVDQARRLRAASEPRPLVGEGERQQQAPLALGGDLKRIVEREKEQVVFREWWVIKYVTKGGLQKFEETEHSDNALAIAEHAHELGRTPIDIWLAKEVRTKSSLEELRVAAATGEFPDCGASRTDAPRASSKLTEQSPD